MRIGIVTGDFSAPGKCERRKGKGKNGESRAVSAKDAAFRDEFLMKSERVKVVLPSRGVSEDRDTRGHNISEPERRR